MVDPAVLIEQPNIVRTYPPELKLFSFFQARPRKISTHIDEEIEFSVPSDAWFARIAACIKSDLPIHDG